MSKNNQVYSRNFDELPASAFIRKFQLLDGVLPFSAPTLDRYVKNKTFPAPVKISSRCTAWRVGEVREWLAGLVGKETFQ